MIDIQTITGITDSPKFIEFAEFIISETGARDFPNYRQMDLMKIPSLVPSIWVLETPNDSETGYRYRFSGTSVDEHFGRTLTGLLFEDIYPGEDYDQVVTGCYHQAVQQKKVAYTHRTVRYNDNLIDKTNLIETMLFPCSGNNADIDFAIGLATYAQVDQMTDNIYTLL